MCVFWRSISMKRRSTPRKRMWSPCSKRKMTTADRESQRRAAGKRRLKLSAARTVQTVPQSFSKRNTNIQNTPRRTTTSSPKESPSKKKNPIQKATEKINAATTRQ